MKSKAAAHANIALVKYWGKRDVSLNLPDVGSLSITLEHLKTTTEVVFSEELKQDRLILNRQEASEKERIRISKFLDWIRSDANLPFFAEIRSENNFPTSAGLASSASAFAALALAAADAAGLRYSRRQLSILARLGSGSAARSVYGGFVEMYKGRLKDGSDAYAEQIADENYWDLRVLIAITSIKKKKIGSTDGMNLSKKTSPYYQAWIDSSVRDLKEMRKAVSEKDFEKVGEIAEFSCLKMHALAMSANPGLLYWNAATLTLINEVKSLRTQGVPVFFTIDAGPQVKIVTIPEYETKVSSFLAQMPEIERIISTRLGGNAYVIEDA